MNGPHENPPPAAGPTPKVPRVLIPFADGTEEMELVILADVLRRAGCEVVLASPGGEVATCSRGVVLSPDAVLEQQRVGDFDALVIPGGGPGTERLAASRALLDLVCGFDAAGKVLGAVCAGPRVLDADGVLHGRAYTCHPGVATELPRRSTERVVTDGHIHTSQGPGTSMEFALELVEVLRGAEIRDQVAAPLILPA